MSTSPSLHISDSVARTVMLAAQGLHRRPDRPATKTMLLETIRRMGTLQIDTIHVVARSPYFVLWSRLGHYAPHLLEELLAEGSLFEYWSHEACFLPIEDYPLYRHRMINPAVLLWKYPPQEWIAAHQTEVDRVLAFIRENGPTRSSDFKRTDGKSGQWWGWKPEKRALEMLFTSGELMIARRHNFQRVYDLRQRVLPSWTDDNLPSLDQARRILILKAIQALGITTARWVADYFRMKKQQTLPLIEQLAAEGAILPVQVEGWETAYIHSDHRKTVRAAVSGKIKSELTTLLSPFDPLVWDRARTRAVFGFDYTLECYTPAPKRRYGYFTLPILRHDALIGRLDAKAHRREGVFEVKILHMEPQVRLTDDIVTDLAHTLRECAAWHGTPEVRVSGTQPTGLSKTLIRAIEQKQ